MAGVLLRAQLPGDPLLNPNFVKLAEAYGIRSMAVFATIRSRAGRSGSAHT